MLAAVATAIRCAAWARKGPATAPARVAAAWRVRNTALTRPRAALARLAEALGMRLIITLVPDEDSQQAAGPSPAVPASLVRLGRTARFRQAVKAMTAALDADAGEFPARLVTALATLAHLTGQDLTEPDWWRILDALVLVAAHPAAS
jgi:hypothetical protein